MNSETILLILALVLFASLIVIQLLKKQNRLETVLISKEKLVTLINDKSFKTLYLNPFSNASFIKRDTIRLEEHIETIDSQGPLLKTKLFEASKESGETLDREINYSIYRLRKPDIEKILKHFPGAHVIYFLFEATLYIDADQHKFIAYKIFPADH